MNDDERDELASAYLDGEITDGERREVEGDPALGARVDELRAVAAAIARPPAPPADGDQRREAALGAALAELSARRPDAPPSLTAARAGRGRRPAWVRLAPVGAVAAALLVVVGIALVSRSEDGDRSDSFSAVADSADSTVEPEAQAPPAGSAELVVPGDGDDAAAEATAQEDAARDDADDAAGGAEREDSGGEDSAAAAPVPESTVAAFDTDADGTDTSEGASDTTSTDTSAADTDEADTDGAPLETTAVLDSAAAHVCDDAVRLLDPEVGELTSVDDEPDGRQTLTYEVPTDPAGERRYRVDPRGCAQPERLPDTEP